MSLCAVAPGRRRVLVAVVLACALIVSLSPAVAAGTHDAAVQRAEERLHEARARETALVADLDRAAERFELAQAHRLRIEEESREVERALQRTHADEAAAQEALRRRVVATYRSPHTELALASAVLDAPDAATVLHRAKLVSRLTIGAADEIGDVRSAQARTAAALRQRRIIATGAAGAVADQMRETERLREALRAAAEAVAEADSELEQARRRAAALRRAAVPGAAAVSADGKHCPVAGHVGFIDSWGFPRSGGRRHQGVDMFAEYGTPLVAVADGVARRVWVDRLGGLSIDLLGDDGDRYYYAHLSAVSVSAGQRVQAGAPVGAVGDSGNARGTPPHLHWQLHPDDGSPVNPFPLARALCRAGEV